MKDFKTKNIWRALGIFILLFFLGTIGFNKFSHISISDSIYQTLLLILAHYDHYGFTEPISRIIVIFIIISSLVLLGYLLKWFLEYMMGFNDNIRRKKVKTLVAKLKDHYIVCGLGRVGSQVMLELKNEDVEFVGLDRDKRKVDEAIKNGHLAFQIDSTEEDALTQAGINRAAGVVACLGSDSENLLVTLAARSMNQNLYIVARASRADSEPKLKRAGADRVALPYQIGGYHMAAMVIRPNIVDYMDVVNGTGSASNLRVEEVVIGEKSKLAGHRLEKILGKNFASSAVIAINSSDGISHVRPTGKEVIYPGDRLILLGEEKELINITRLLGE